MKSDDILITSSDDNPCKPNAERELLRVAEQYAMREGTPICSSVAASKLVHRNPGTIRNRMSSLRRKKLLIKVPHIWGLYWPRSVPLPNTGWASKVMSSYDIENAGRLPMTANPTGMDSTPESRDLTQILRTLPLGEHAIHDIHINFSVKGLYSAIRSSKLVARLVERSGDLELEPVRISTNRYAKITVHSSKNNENTVSIILASTMEPFSLDEEGIFQFHTAIGIVSGSLSERFKGITLPTLSAWIIKRWDFGRDGQHEYSGKQFYISVRAAQKTLNAYVKTLDNGKKILRLESVEKPDLTVSEIIYKRIELG